MALWCSLGYPRTRHHLPASASVMLGLPAHTTMPGWILVPDQLFSLLSHADVGSTLFLSIPHLNKSFYHRNLIGTAVDSYFYSTCWAWWVFSCFLSLVFELAEHFLPRAVPCLLLLHWLLFVCLEGVAVFQDSMLVHSSCFKHTFSGWSHLLGDCVLFMNGLSSCVSVRLSLLHSSLGVVLPGESLLYFSLPSSPTAYKCSGVLSSQTLVCLHQPPKPQF